MLSGFVAGHKMHSTLVSAGAWIPLTLTFLERSFKSESQRLLQLTYGAIAFSFVILAGYPAMVVYGGIVVGGYAFFRILFETPPKQEKSKNLHEFLLFCKSLSLIFIPGFLLGAVAVVPTLNSLPLLTRRQISFEYFSLPAWNFEAFPMILFPFFYGATYPAALYPSPYSGPASLWEVSSFIGVLPLAFFLLVFWIRNEVTEGRVWIAQFLVAMCLVAGGRAPFYEFFSRKFPIITAGKNMLLVWFETSNLFMLTGILLAVISACVLVAWLKGHPRHQFAFGIAVTLFVVSIGSLLLYRVLYQS